MTSTRNRGWQCGNQLLRGGFLWSEGRACLRELDVSCRGNIGGNVLGDNPEVFDSQANFFIPHDGSKSRESFHTEASTRSTWRRRRQFGCQPYEETAMAQQENLVVCQDAKFNAVYFPLKNLRERNPESHGLCFSAFQHIGLLSEGGSASILSGPTSGCKVAVEDLPRKLCAYPSLEWDDSWKSLPHKKLQLSWGQGVAEYERSKAECEREDKVLLARECKRKAPATPYEQLDCSGIAAMFDFCEDGQFFKKNKVDSGEAVGAETSKHLSDSREGSESADDHEQFKGLDTFVITRNKVLVELEKVEMYIDQVDKELQILCQDCLDEHGSDSISKMAQASSVSCVKSLPQNGILPYSNIRLDCVHDRCSQATYLSLQDSFENKEFANSKDNPSNFGFCQAPGLSGTFCTESQGIVMNLLQANKQEAWRGSGLLAHLLYNGADDITEEYQCLTLEDMPCWKRNIDSHQYNKKLLIQQISAQKRASMFKERVLAFKYCAMRQIWKKKQYIMHHQRDCHKRLRIVRSGVEDLSLVKSNTLMKQLMTTKSQCRPMRMPAMILDGEEKLFRRFLSTNGLICDPAASEQERAFMNPWTPGEKRTFYEKFIELGKNFRHISAYLDHKTSGDCVQFYYRHFKCGVTQMQTRMQRQCSLSCGSDLAAARGTQPPAWNAVTVDPAFDNCHTHSGFTCTAQKLTVDPRLKVHADLRSPATTSSVHTYNFQGTAMGALSPCLSSATLPPGSLLKEKHIQQVTGSSPASSTLGEFPNECKGLRARFVEQEYARVKDDSVNSLWNDHERLPFTDAVAMLGRDFKRISLHVGSKNEGQRQAVFSKACKQLKLDLLSSRELSSVPAFHVNLVDLGSTRNTGNSQCAETRVKNEDVEEPKNKDIDHPCPGQEQTLVTEIHAGSFSLMKNSCDREIYGGCQTSPIATLEHSAVHNSISLRIDLKPLLHFQGACIESNNHTPDSRSMGAVGSLIQVTSPSQTSAINATSSKLSSADNEGLAMNDSCAEISLAGHFTSSPMSSTAAGCNKFFQKRSVQPKCTVQGLFQRPACSKTTAKGLPQQYKAVCDFELSRWHWQQKCLMRRRQPQQQWQYHKQRKQQKHQHQEMAQQNWWWHRLERQ